MLKVKVKSVPIVIGRARRLIRAGTYLRLLQYLLPLDGILVHRRLPPSNLLVPIYTSGWREALGELSVLRKNTTWVPRPGFELSTFWSQVRRSNH